MTDKARMAWLESAASRGEVKIREYEGDAMYGVGEGEEGAKVSLWAAAVYYKAHSPAPRATRGPWNRATVREAIDAALQSPVQP